MVVTGENGSGKSILLEMILKAFISIQNVCDNEKQKSKCDFNFEIIYSFSIQNNLISFFTAEQIKEIEGKDILVYITYVENKITFEIKAESNILLINDNLMDLRLFLPTKIIAYSSGQNETLSRPIYEYNINRFKEYYDNMRAELITHINEKKFIFLDEKYKFLNLISNLLFNSNNMKNIYELIGVRNINSFQINLEFYDYKNREIKLPEEKLFLIDKLKYYGNKIIEINNLISYHFETNLENSNKIKEDFKNDAKTFYELLEFLEDMNLYKVRSNMINPKYHSNVQDYKKIYNAYDKGKKVFEIENVKVTVNNGSVIDVNDISDGEFQVLQIIGCISIYEDDNILFLFDEPETHFNIRWKAKFIEDLLQVINNTAQMIFSTHSLEILTDIKKKKITLIKNGCVEQINIETFGTNTTLIGAELFKNNKSVSNIAYKRYKEYMDRITRANIEELNEIEENIKKEFGDSAERILLFYEINKNRSR
nr:AAA family ATPase [Clostridium saccharoperbutylacetonicum]